MLQFDFFEVLICAKWSAAFNVHDSPNLIAKVYFVQIDTKRDIFIYDLSNIYTARKTRVHKSSMACSLRVSNQFPSLGNELSVQAWTLRKLMLSYICGCLYTEFISQIWKLLGNYK